MALDLPKDSQAVLCAVVMLSPEVSLGIAPPIVLWEFILLMERSGSLARITYRSF